MTRSAGAAAASCGDSAARRRAAEAARAVSPSARYARTRPRRSWGAAERAGGLRRVAFPEGDQAEPQLGVGPQLGDEPRPEGRSVVALGRLQVALQESDLPEPGMRRRRLRSARLRGEALLEGGA